MKSHPGVAAKTFATLEQAGIEASLVSTSPIKIACHVPSDRRRPRRPGPARGVRAWLVVSPGSASSARRARSARSRSSCCASAATATSACSRARARRARRSAGRSVEEATPEALAAGDLDLCLFSVGTAASRELVPHAVAGGAVCVDKSAAYRLEPGIPLVVPEVNGVRAAEHDGIVANPNCCAIPLTCALKPLHDAAGLERVRVATYQSVSGAGAQAMERLRAPAPEEHDLRMDWSFDGVEFDEEEKLREETRKILELPELPVSATCVRVPVLVGHARGGLDRDRRAALRPSRRRRCSPTRPASGSSSSRPRRRQRAATTCSSAGSASDPTTANGLVLFIVGDNLRKGAALNAIQIAELLLAQQRVAA